MAKKKVFSIGNALADGLEETITAAHNYSGELRVEIVPLKRIETDPDNPRDLMISFTDLFKGLSPSDPHYSRKEQEIESLQSLALSIKDQGIINPIVVYKYGEKYRLVAGERRTLASIIAGKTDIQAKILDSKPTELKISLLQWIENIERSDLSLWERLKNLHKIAAAYADKKGILTSDITVTEFSNLIGCAKSHAINYKAVLAADEELSQFIFENKIKNLEKAAVIAGIKGKETRDHAIQECIQGATLKKLKVIAEQSKASARIKMPIERRGRQATAVNLGVTKNITVAKVILDSILNNSSLTHISAQFNQVDWNNHKSITDTFKQLLKKLEELHV